MALSRSALPALSRSLQAGRSVAARHALLAAPRYSTSPPPTSTKAQSPLAPKVTDAPLPVPERPQYPPASDPFHPEDARPAATPAAGAAKHGKLKIAVVKALAKLMGYNSRSTTAIRETGRICGAVVRGVERSRRFWYDECNLPSTYQTFFQLHLLYLLLVVPRLRALAGPASLAPGADPLSTVYQSELLTHFFDLAENQMRVTLGRGERERNVRKYMQEMGQQWKGASVGFDYAVARGQRRVVEGHEELGIGAAEEEGGDAEMASWVWRNLFGARGTPIAATTPTPAPPGSTPADAPGHSMDDLRLAEQLAHAVRFIRREMHRLDQLTDEQVINGEIGEYGIAGPEGEGEAAADQGIQQQQTHDAATATTEDGM